MAISRTLPPGGGSGRRATIAFFHAEGAMAGYSGTPLPKKLGIKDDHAVLVIDAPAGFAATLAPLPHGVELKTEFTGGDSYDVIVFFTKSRADLQKRFKALM